MSLEKNIEIRFKDPKLQKVVAEQLGILEDNHQGESKLEIQENDIEKITVIEARTLGITSLEGIEKFTNLREIYFEENEVEDLSPLSELYNLIEISFCRNRIKDISPIKNLKNLYQISFDGNDIEDISPLKGLSNLGVAIFRECNVSDLTPISELKSLEEIWFDKNNIMDISPLKDLSNLKHVYLMDNNISDLSPLSKLVNIEDLYINENNISSIEPLKEHNKLIRLSIFQNRIEHISPIKKCEDLSFLLMYDNPIKDYESLYRLKNVSIDREEQWKANIKCTFKEVQPLPNDLEKIYYATEDKTYFMEMDTIIITCENKGLVEEDREHIHEEKYYDDLECYDEYLDETNEEDSNEFQYGPEEQWVEIGQPLIVPVNFSKIKFIHGKIVDCGEDTIGTYLIVEKRNDESIELGEGRIQISFSPSKSIHGVDKIIKEYPWLLDFHNQEILQINMENGSIIISIKINSIKTKNNNDFIIKFKFSYVSDLYLSYLEENNTIEKFEFKYDGDKIDVDIEVISGAECSFKCMKIESEILQPFFGI